MTVGLSSTVAAAILNVWRNTTLTGLANVYVKLHTGDPGSAGTSNASAVTTRNAIVWGAPSAGSMALSTLSDYSMTATETVSHVSLWDASTAGNFLNSAALTASKSVTNGDTLHFSTFTVAYTPIAA